MEGGKSDSQDNSLSSRASVVLLDAQLSPHSSEFHSLTQQTSYHPSSARNNQSSTLFAQRCSEVDNMGCCCSTSDDSYDQPPMASNRPAYRHEYGYQQDPYWQEQQRKKDKKRKRRRNAGIIAATAGASGGGGC
jgi:hypothetical protein